MEEIFSFFPFANINLHICLLVKFEVSLKVFTYQGHLIKLNVTLTNKQHVALVGVFFSPAHPCKPSLILGAIFRPALPLIWVV